MAENTTSRWSLLAYDSYQSWRSVNRLAPIMRKAKQLLSWKRHSGLKYAALTTELDARMLMRNTQDLK